MLDGLRQRPRRARSILQYRHIGGARVRRIGGTGGLQGGPEGVIDSHYRDFRELPAEGLGTLLRQEQARLAIVEAERQPLQREEVNKGTATAPRLIVPNRLT